MTWFLLVVAIAGLAVGAAAGALAVRARRDRDERLQVVPGVRSEAPVAWAGAHTPEARLHRRLGDAVRSMRASSSLDAAGLAAQRTAMEQEALRIDAQLVAAAALAEPHRERTIADVAELVARYEAAVAELVTSSSGDRRALDAVISESELRLQALEAARAEVERLDGGEPG